ncbi:uro-adherence factor A-like [Syngnathus scovelli]|uniref:uro-adherence factor A-like n=1 Tax=Syngnathus scovelli TaxID=161590 RepID=UPI002110CEF7|nr:apoptotic chromatin condensation inducer in the nucleus-like [Syngnathus scovelli]
MESDNISTATPENSDIPTSDEKLDYVMLSSPVGQMYTSDQDQGVRRETSPQNSKHQIRSTASSPVVIRLDDELQAAIKSASKTVYEGMVQYVDFKRNVDVASKSSRASPYDEPKRDVSPAAPFEGLYPEDSDLDLPAPEIINSSQEEHSEEPFSVTRRSPTGQELDHNTPTENVLEEEYSEAGLSLGSTYLESDALEVDNNLDEETLLNPLSSSRREEPDGEESQLSTSACQSDAEEADRDADDETVLTSWGDGNATPPSYSISQGFDPYSVGSDVDEEKPSMSKSPREEQLGEKTPSPTSSCQLSDGVALDSNVEEEKQSKSLSLSPRDGDATPPSISTGQELDLLDAASDVEEENQSKYLSVSPKDEHYDKTPPTSPMIDQEPPTDVNDENPSKPLDRSPPTSPMIAQEPPTDVNDENPSKPLDRSPPTSPMIDQEPPTTVNDENPSKPLNLSPIGEQYNDATSPSPSIGQEFEPLEVAWATVDEERCTKYLSLSPIAEQYSEEGLTSPSISQSFDHQGVESEIDEEKESKPLSPSPKDEQYRETLPPSNSISQSFEHQGVDSDVDEEKESKSLSPSPKDEQYEETLPPSNSIGQDLPDVLSDVDEEKPSKSWSPSPPGEHYSDATSPATSIGQDFEPLEVESVVDEEKPLSVSPREEHDENVTASSISTDHDHLDVDVDLAEQKRDGTPPLSSTQEVALVEVDSDLVEEKSSESLSPSRPEEQEMGESPHHFIFPELDAEKEIENVVSNSLNPSPLEENSNGGSPESYLDSHQDSTHEFTGHGSHSPGHGSHSPECCNDADKADSSSPLQVLLPVADDGGVILPEDDHEDSIPESLKPKSSSQSSSPSLACLDVDIRPTSTTICEASIQEDDKTPNEDTAYELRPSLSIEELTDLADTFEDFGKENFNKTSPHDETLFVQELSQTTSSASPEYTQDLIPEATTHQDLHMDKDSINEQTEQAQSSRHPQLTSFPQILERCLSDAMKTCSSAILQALLNQATEYSAAVKVGKGSKQRKDIPQSKNNATTSAEQQADSRSKHSEHKRCQRGASRDIRNKHPEKSMAAPDSNHDDGEILADILPKSQICKVHPIVNKMEDDSEHPCPHYLFEVPKNENEAKNAQSTTKENVTRERHKKREHKRKSSKDSTRSRKLKNRVVQSASLVPQQQLPVLDSTCREKKYFLKVKNFFARMRRCQVCPKKWKL